MGERLRFPYPEGRLLINRHMVVAEINSQGKKYGGTPTDFRIRREGTLKWEHSGYPREKL
jgi:hypothetical protein